MYERASGREEGGTEAGMQGPASPSHWDLKLGSAGQAQSLQELHGHSYKANAETLPGRWRLPPSASLRQGQRTTVAQAALRDAVPEDTPRYLSCPGTVACQTP